MTGLAVDRGAPGVPMPRHVWDELVRRQPTLARYGALCVVCAAAAFLAALVDPRQFGGVPLWLKPGKFFLSVGIFALSSAWFFGLVRPERQSSRLMRGTVAVLVASGLFELVYITLQAALGQASHFNRGDVVHGVLYGLMGIGAVLLIGTNLPLAWEIARRPAPNADPDYRRAVVVGLVLTFLLGGLLGGYMGAQAGHAVGAEVGHLPIVGWNRGGGDLRVAHMLGMHVEQALPAVVVASGALGVRRRGVLLWIAAALWSAATLGAFAQAVAGRPVL